MKDNKLTILRQDELDQHSRNAGEHLRKMREREHFTREMVTSNPDNADQNPLPSLSTLKSMENGHGKTSFDTFIQMFHIFNGTDRDAAILFGNRESAIFVDDSHDSSPAHIARLRKFENQKFTVFYMDEMDELKAMKLNFVHIINHSYVQGNARVGKYSYDCKLVSPSNSKYVYIYMTSTTSFIDRALLILPEIEKVVGRLKRGIGIMTSISADEHTCPTIQMFVLWSNVFEKPNEETLKGHLMLKREQVSQYMLRLSDLIDRNKEFVRKVKPIQIERKF